MNYATIKYCDIANGPGVRTSLFVSGCTHHCRNCFNAEAWDFNYGKPFTEEVIQDILKSCGPQYVAGLSLLGGEPMEPVNQRGLVILVRHFKKLFPEKTVWCYTGYTYETDLRKNGKVFTEVTDELLSLTDVLVDGEFIQEQYDISLRFRGSGNQRLIDLAATRRSGETKLWQDEAVFATHKWQETETGGKHEN